MLSENMELQGIGAVAPVPDWLKGLLRSIRHEAIKPRDPRVKSLWGLLAQRKLLQRSPWLKAVLKRIWGNGLSARPRPRTTQRIVHRLRQWGILPQKTTGTVSHHPTPSRPLTPATMQAMRPVALKPVASVRPTAMQPLQPVKVQPAAMQVVRK